MNDNQYLGKPCKYGHRDELGKNMRYKHSGACMECARTRSTDFFKNNPNYHKEYYQMQRRERPEKLREYFETQKANGNRSNKKNKPNKENPVNDTN